MSFLCSITPTGANAEVLRHFSDLDALTNQYSSLALGFTSKLGTFQLPNLSYSVTLPGVFNYGLTAPGEIPTLDKVSTVGPGELPEVPKYVGVPQVMLDPYPDTAPSVPEPNFNDNLPTPYIPSFGAIPDLVTVTNPTFGDRTSGIVAPVLRSIVLSPAPQINWDAIDVSVMLPTFNAVPPDPNEFTFTPDAYVQQILPDVKAVIQQMLQGQVGIPAAVEDAIWVRAAERESALAFRAEQEAYQTYASRGFTLPGGALNYMVASARQDATDKKSSLSRDVMIEKFKEQIDIIKTAVAQGIAFENVFVQIYVTVQGLKLESAKFAVQIALSVFNANVTKFQTDAELVRLQLESKRELIQIELGKLQGYEAQLRAAQIEGTLNQQDIDLYNSRLNAVLTDARIYETEVSAARLTLDENLQILQQAKLLIDQETAKLMANETEVRIAAQGVQIEATKQAAWSTRAQTFVAQMGAWSTAQNVKIENARLLLGENSELTQRYDAQIQGFNSKANLVRTMGDLIVQNNQTYIQAYTAKTQGTSSFNLALIEQMRGLMASMQQNVELAIKNGEINIQNSLEGKRLQEQGLSTGTQAVTQVLASALSGHSTSASISDSSSVNGSCSYSTSQTIDN